jgi:hypothetical protein
MQIKRALERGDRAHLVCHEDVLVFRKPATKQALKTSSSTGRIAHDKPRAA